MDVCAYCLYIVGMHMGLGGNPYGPVGTGKAESVKALGGPIWYWHLCYIVGMHMGLGGNPYGPAGTGKTESVKALGGLFGRQVLVFNCDEVCTYVYCKAVILI